MPIPASADDFFEVVRKSEVVPASRLDAFLSDAAGGPTPRAPREVADRLIASGLLTHFQAEQMLQGKWLGFFLGKYKVLERLGSGGMGTVYLCEHTAVGRKVAVKVLPRGHAADPAVLARFYREARAAGALDHPHLVKAHDVDQDGGQHFLVMDYVDGNSLQELVGRFGPLGVARACDYVRQAACGLAAAHEAGLIHRDVKPANIMLERNGNVRVLDLGLARFADDDQDQLTLQYDQDNLLGTPDYLAPEQALNGHEADSRSDIYGLGATFYFLLTGQPPFAGGKTAQKLIRHQVSQPTSPRELRPEVPEAVEAVQRRMMAKDPAARYQTLAGVIEDLTLLVGGAVPPPSEEEMPKLSPAAAAPSLLGHAGPRAVCTPRRNLHAGTRRSGNPEPSGLVSTLQPTVPASELATPNSRASAETPAAVRIVAPSRLLEQAKAAKPDQRIGIDFSVVLLAVLSGLIAFASTVWFLLP